MCQSRRTDSTCKVAASTSSYSCDSDELPVRGLLPGLPPERRRGHTEQLTYQVKQALAAQQTPMCEGMLLYVKLPDGLAGITYDVHAVSGQEGFVTADTAVYLTFGNDHDHDGETGHHHEH